MKLNPLPQKGTELLDKNPWWEYRRDRYEKPNGQEGDYFYLHTPGAVIVAAQETDGRFVLVRQMRYLWQRVSLEFVGGGIKPGKSAEVSAEEELLEEAGIRTKQLEKLGVINPMKGATDEVCHLFFASDLELTEAEPEDSEQFEIVRMTLEEIGEAILDGRMWDSASIAAYTFICLKKQSAQNEN